ncbi:MAG: HAD-IIB family hydrolase [Planctomycetota bacterium]
MGGRERPLLVATDLDGCLLDDATYDLEPARPALAALALRRALVVLASSKTAAEMMLLGQDLGFGSPLIVENGGALLVPAARIGRPPAAATMANGYWTLVLGERRERLLALLEVIAAEAGARVRSFAVMDEDEIVRRTGLAADSAARARQREYDEPFLLEGPERLPYLEESARAHGLRVSRGARFLHLTGATDKGAALRVLLALEAAEGRDYSTIGLGDSPNDAPLLEAVDRPILVPRPGGSVDPLLCAALRGAECAPAPGPRGWNAAVLAVLGGKRLPLES